MGISGFSFLILVLATVFGLSWALPTEDAKNNAVLSQPLSVTPSPDLPQWIVRDSNNNTCMMMAMDATIQVYPETTIPSSANAAQKTGSCDTENAVFTLEWTSLDTSYSLSISFEVNGDAYKMKEISGFRMTGFNAFHWDDTSSSYPSATVGNSMICKEFNSGTLYFTEYQFQPFAQQSQEQYGKAEKCNFQDGKSIWSFVIIVAICLVFFAVVGGVAFLILNKLKAKRGYTELK